MPMDGVKASLSRTLPGKNASAKDERRMIILLFGFVLGLRFYFVLTALNLKNVCQPRCTARLCSGLQPKIRTYKHTSYTSHKHHLKISDSVILGLVLFFKNIAVKCL